MTFQQLRYLLEISKHKSISKAATALFVTQPSISKAIRDLENELQITILDRTNKGVAFTQQGNELLFYAKVLLEQTEAIHDHFNKDMQSKKRKLSISSQHYTVAVQALAEFVTIQQHSSYEISLREGKSTDVIEDVYSGKSSIGIISISDLNKPYFERHFKMKGLHFTQLATMSQHVFLRKQHPLASELTLTLQQLKPFPYLSYQQEDTLIHVAEETLHLNRLDKILYINDRGTVINLLSHTNSYNIGTGITIPTYMPQDIIAIPLLNGQLIQLGYIQRLNTLLPPEIEAYTALLKQAIAQNSVCNEQNNTL